MTSEHEIFLFYQARVTGKFSKLLLTPVSFAGSARDVSVLLSIISKNGATTKLINPMSCTHMVHATRQTKV